MSIAVEDLWKNATDEAVIESVGKWDSLNEQGQRLVHAEVKRRGLNIAIPEVSAAQSADATKSAHESSGSTHLFEWKIMLAIAAALALVIGLAVLV